MSHRRSPRTLAAALLIGAAALLQGCASRPAAYGLYSDEYDACCAYTGYDAAAYPAYWGDGGGVFLDGGFGADEDGFHHAHPHWSEHQHWAHAGGAWEADHGRPHWAGHAMAHAAMAHAAARFGGAHRG
jgi:hypothetical protein